MIDACLLSFNRMCCFSKVTHFMACWILGMPDEENMRHWSHHHSTDTVDDPVFRAAMRGYDAVSFVFGLEVTWSLIQQRQQEEEEKQALKELEAAQELDKEDSDEDENDDDNDSGEKRSASQDDDRRQIMDIVDNKKHNDDDGDNSDSTTSEEIDDGTWNLSHIYAMDELQSKDPPICDECKNVACSLWKSDKGGESKACLSCQEEGFGGWPDGLEPQDVRHKNLIAELCTKPCTPSSIYNSPTDRSQQIENDSDPDSCKDCTTSEPDHELDPSPSKSPGWPCSACTFWNKPSAKTCKMCFTKKSPKKRKK
jgi:type II secretory pathway pseudopilin PulG